MDNFFEMTGAVWIDEMVLPNGPIPTPITATIKERKLSNQFEPLYETFKPPKLALTGSLRGHYSLVADETILPGQIITEYLGEWAPNDQEGSPYRFGPIESLRMRNFGAMIDDSFPNALPIYLYEVNNLPLRIIFVAIDTIEKGELICFHYGMRHSIKVEGHQEKRLDALLSWLRSAPLPTHITLARQDEGALAKLQYLMQTPTTLKILLDHNQLNRDEVARFLAKPDNLHYLLGVPFAPNTKEALLLQKIHTLIK